MKHGSAQGTRKRSTIGNDPTRRPGLIAGGVVALVAAVASYSHQRQLAAHHGEEWLSYLLPLSVDGLLVVASLAIVIARRNGTRAPLLAWPTLAAGVLVSLAANIAAAGPDLGSRVIAAWPPLAFAGAFELVIRMLRRHEDGGIDGGTLAAATRAAGSPINLADKPTFVYQMFNEADDLLYVGITADLAGRMASHRRHKPWFSEVMETITTVHQSRLEALATEREIIANQVPRYNLQQGSLRDNASGRDDRPPASPASDLDRARQLVKQADATGTEIGRPRLIKALGITDHRAKVLLKQIRDEQLEPAHNGHQVLESAAGDES